MKYFLLCLVTVYCTRIAAQSCDNWLYLPTYPSAVKIGDLDVAGQQLTVEANINRTTPWVGGRLYSGDVVSKHDQPGNTNYLLRPNSAEITTSNGYYITPPICDIDLNKNYHVAMTYDGATLKFYRNGILLSQVAATGDLYQNNFTAKIGLIDIPPPLNENFIGYINNVRIWNVARTQAQIQAFMLAPLPSPTTQAGLLAYYVFDNLKNKQGNATWDGTLDGSAAVGKTNSNCSFLLTDCCPPLTGTLSGSNTCSGGKGSLTFYSTNTAAKPPFTLVYTDGVGTYTETSVQSGIPFTTKNNPAVTTTYRLISIQDASGCAATPASGVTAMVTVGSCSTCTGSLGDPVVNITYGSGGNPAPPLATAAPGASTTYNYIAVTGNPALPTPSDGYYTITNNVPVNPSWFSGAPDHTPNDNNGYMAFFNASPTTGEFYKQTITGLCSGTKYEFAAWVANVLDPARTVGQKPDITFVIEKPDGTVISSFTTGGINQNATMTWKQYGFFFTLPGGTNTVVLKLVNTNPGGAAFIGNDFVIDDITFRACGPNITSSFLAASAQNSKSQCGLNTVGLYGKVASSDYSDPAYLWQISADNGNSWTDLPLSNQTTYNYTPKTGGTYLFRILTAETGNINAASCRVASNVIMLTVNDLPQAALTGNTVCTGEQGKLSFNFTSGSGPFKVNYTDGSTSFSQSNLSTGAISPAPNPVLTTSYQLTRIEDANGCVRTTDFATGSATITVNKVPQVTINNPGSVCSGDSIQLSASGGTNYRWTPAAGLSNPFSSAPKASPALSTTYKVIVSENNCSDSLTTAITVKPKPVISLSASGRICAGDSIQLSAGGGSLYAWSPAIGLSSATTDQPKASPAVTTTYRVIVTNSLSCTDSAKTIVSVYAKPVITVSGNTVICLGDSVQLNSGGGVSYQWFPSAGLNNAFVSNPTASPVSTSVYKVLVTNANQCTDSSFTTVAVRPRPYLNIGADTTVCRPFNLILDATITNGNTYTWNTGNNTPVQSVTQPGLYYIKVTTPFCNVSDSITVNAIGIPVVSLGKDTTICNFQTLQLTPAGKEVSNYLWNTGSTSKSVIADKEGVYSVKGFNKCGNAADSILVNIEVCSDELYFPTAFTPNSDGINDVYKAAYFKGLMIYDYYLRIYNRWGQLVFSTTSIAQGWDGKVNGQRQATSTFIWQAQYRKSANTAPIKKNGTVTLIN